MILHVEASSLERSSSGALTGRIWFEATPSFPDDAWYDFPIVVLTSWLELLVAIASGKPAGELRFMEGPYRAVVTACGDGSLKIEFEAGFPGKCVGSLVAELADALDEAIEAARKIELACAANQWLSPDLRVLADARESAQLQAARITANRPQ